ncbi:ParA family protein [Microbacterium sp. EYE_5]|uniref:ParA family protein n=1 Tax=unclassified Microbacterium TaxID=2609290 RepID=UPI002003786C|nr:MULTISPECIES: ParA family protein [unclassified Microbacterium]MCK6081239.1 ParA family protein [Microbacterium sp. EYE_382]MCK6086509.1 ParA family protein [Microbacterium sp. EYE_384]MCK6123993.1 ParA family protein [Microbacterium sp. EYE_80]MCK6126902.1 ParA family protein [Microbacterium sp. EYE_79]MCK6142194.1 ParA family protein [Microbacterium sp. EYE_39]
MTISSEPAPAYAHLTGETARFTAADGSAVTFEADDVDTLRAHVIERARADASAADAPLNLFTSGDRGDHHLVVAPDGDIDVELDERTVTRGELRQQAWWTTDPEPAPEDEEEALQAVEPSAPETVVDEVPRFFPPATAAPPVPAGEATDDRDEEPDEDEMDEDLDETRDAAWAPARATEIPVAVGAGDAVASDDHDVDADASEPAPASAPADDAPAGVTDDAPADDALLGGSDDDAAADHADAARPAEGLPAADTAFEASVTAAVAAVRGPRPSFIEPPAEHPAKVAGWRSFFVRLGIPVRPSRAEIERAEREKAVSRQWAGCRAIAVANGKGGVGKTMTTAVLSAVFARHGGGNVLAWDNNDTRGTLGWRTEQGDYDTTIRDLLPEAPGLLEATASVSDISRFVHHQSVDRYDVLRSNPELLAADQRITTADFDLLAQVAARYYRMVIFDSGNDESADRWLRMIDSAHQLVVPTLAAPESAESAALLLDALRSRDEHSRRLADGAVVVVGQSERSGIGAAQRIAAGFEGHVRAVEIIPFDDALKAGRIRYDALQSRTKDAWMRAAAAVAQGL